MKGFVLGALAVAAIFAFGCSRKLPDPAPPATSGELPSAPPGALGAQRASLDPTPPPRTPFPDPDEVDEEEEQDAGSGTAEDEAGVTL